MNALVVQVQPPQWANVRAMHKKPGADLVFFLLALSYGSLNQDFICLFEMADTENVGNFGLGRSNIVPFSIRKNKPRKSLNNLPVNSKAENLDCVVKLITAEPH